MKQGRKPTVAQRRWMEAEGFDSVVWRVSKWTAIEAVLVHKDTHEVKTIRFFD